MPRAATGPLPQVDDGRGGDWETGPRSRPAPGPVPGGRGPRGGTGPRPRPTGPMATGTGPYDRPSTGTGGYERPSTGTGSYERPSTGTGGYERPSTGTGPYERPSRGTGGYERPSTRTGPYERPSTGTGSYERPSTGTGGYERPSTRTGPYERPATGPMPQLGRLTPPSGYPDGAGGMRPDRQEWQAASYEGSWYPEEPQWDNGFPETDPNLRYREPGPGMPGYRGSREHRYGGDRY